MDDELEQLLDNLKLRKMKEIFQRELDGAEKRGASYSELFKRLLREEYQAQQARFLGHRIGCGSDPEQRGKFREEIRNAAA